MSVTSNDTGRSIGPHHEVENSYWRLRMPHCLDLIKDWGDPPEWVSETMLRYKLSDRGSSAHRTLDLASISSRFAADDGNPSASTTGDLAVDQVESPDGRWKLRLVDGALVICDARIPEAGWRQISVAPTSPGEVFGGHSGITASTGSAAISSDTSKPLVKWSPDSRFVIYQGLDEGQLTDMPLLRNAPDESASPIVTVHKQPVMRSGALAQVRMFVFDIQKWTNVQVNVDLGPVTWLTPLELRRIGWPQGGTMFYLLTSTWGEGELRLWEIDPLTGRGRTVLTENSTTYAESNLDIGSDKQNFAVLPRRRRVIWFSERSGWGHLYLISLDSGQLIRPLTSGNWLVRDLLRVDEEAGFLWFTAGSDFPDVDPYHCHLYRTSLDDDCESEPHLLTPEATHHRVGISPDGRFFWDLHGDLETPIECAVKDSMTGEQVVRLWKSDYSAYLASAPKAPIRFKVFSADGKHGIFGVLFLPSDFDSSRKYPFIDNVYGFPQTIYSPKAHPFGPWQAIAERGFVVMVLDGSGTAFRSKSFHDVSYGHLHDATIPDHVAAVRQLADRFEWIDTDRLGIFGSSGGGYATLRAMLSYSGTYKVGVAMSTDIDYRDSIPYHLAKYQHPSDTAAWAKTDLCSDADQLAGRLLLVWGEMDDNVHPRGMIKILKAFIAAGKHPDVLVMPDARHGASQTDYVLDRVGAYFTSNLI
jgi:dipeptidyl-peptidase 4